MFKRPRLPNYARAGIFLFITPEHLPALRRAIALALFDPRALEALARCPHERVVQATLDLALAELESMRDPALRRLAAGEGGHG